MSRIFLSPPHMSGKELDYIHKVFESNYIAPLGEYVNRFEKIIGEYTNAESIVALSSGTAAIHLALRVLGIGEGDVVLASSFTFIGSVSAIKYQGATPVFIDSDYKSWNLDPSLLKDELESRKSNGDVMPKALIVTHLYGQMADMVHIMKLSDEYGFYVIEDAAESLGATINGQQSGTFGHFGVYSFNGNKILTTSGGGALVGKNPEHIKKALFLATQAKEDTPHYEHEELGYNYRMSNVLAAIGVAQMEVLSERVAQRRQVYEWYRQELKNIDEITFMPELENAMGNRWLTTLTFEKSSPEKIMKALAGEQIESRPLWKPMHAQPLFKDAKSCVNGVSDTLFSKGICLPSGSSMSEYDVKRVVNIVKKSLF